MATETTRRSLIDRLRDLEDHGAWQEFDDLYRELILRYGLRRGLQAADAEDVRQEVMLILTQTLPRFEYRPEAGRFRDFLGTIARNAIWKRIASLGRSPELLSADVLALRPESAEASRGRDDLWDEEWTQHHFRTAMARLRAHFQASSLAIFDELLSGQAVEEIAARHGTTCDAIYKIKQRVRDALREHIERQLLEENGPRKN